MARFVYIDESGSGGMKRHPILTLAAVLVDEEMVQAMAEAVRQVAWTHLGWVPVGFELHG